MTSPSPVLAASQRAWQYWYTDGLGSIVLGMSNLLMALCVLNPPHPPRMLHSLLYTALWFGGLALYVAINFRLREIVEWLKERITYPRTGYVTPPCMAEQMAGPPNLVGLSVESPEGLRAEEARFYAARSRRTQLTIALVVSVIFAMLLIGNRWICTVAGFAFALAMWFARKDYPFSWFVLAGFPVVGLCLSLFAGPSLWGSPRAAYFLASWGVLFLLDGSANLIRYLWQNPAPRTPAA